MNLCKPALREKLGDHWITIKWTTVLASKEPIDKCLLYLLAFKEQMFTAYFCIFPRSCYFTSTPLVSPLLSCKLGQDWIKIRCKIHCHSKNGVCTVYLPSLLALKDYISQSKIASQFSSKFKHTFCYQKQTPNSNNT